ncbi:glucosamine-6-phosphate deaminase [Mesoterricola sediminis]|uniref:Glucosamine-6-phosphate deaminase n=1 Tax=Mesoterricola sediminis TaxID=2927980 RepID=A0AA48H8V6_9BACT|nr:glucosamine-6-phosphate deaminase [Mesoterricola sediminis]BDU78073.1 glucosamine-6-phosphate deaminase [Mesoterricola sediminis]
MEVLILPDRERAATLAARIIARELRADPGLVLGLATGRTMERVYARLADLHAREGLDFSRCTTFNLDEYIGIPADHPGSYRRYMDERLFGPVDIPRARTHLPDGMAPDLAAACRDYEARIRDAGGIGLQLLGLGSDGHIGFNEPLSALRSRTREKALTPATLAQNAEMFGGDPDRVPRRALTMGVGTILDSRRCLMLVTGETKADILARAVEGPITAMVTASALQLHPCCQVVVDEEAAARLQGTDYYRWILAHEPEWASDRDLLA